VECGAVGSCQEYVQDVVSEQLCCLVLLLPRPRSPMNGDGASIKVLPVINFVIGTSEEASTPEEHAEIMRQATNLATQQCSSFPNPVPRC